MKILITGGVGYIGTELVKVLNQDDNVSQIIVYDNLWKDNYNLFTLSGVANGKVQFIKAELLDSRQLSKALQGVDVVYHLAAHVDSKLINANHHLYEQINNWGTAELVYAIEDSNVKKVIYLSSTAVYGDSMDLISSETLPNPKTFYGTSKLRGEEHMVRLSEKIDVYNLRVGNVYGFGTSMRMDTVINQFAFSSVFENRIKILGKGNQKRAFIHIDSLIDVLSTLKNKKTISPDIYNLVESNYSILELADIFKALLPTMEMLFINQHLSLRNIEVESDSRINKLINNEIKDLAPALELLLNRFYESK